MDPLNRPLLSILIPTLPERADSAARLLRLLYAQAWGPVEILTNPFAGPTGAKRNDLLARAAGEYVCFVDDDDLVADDYVARVLKACERGLDCCSLEGVIHFDHKPSRPFRNSIDYNTWTEIPTGFVRTPNHLNAVRRRLAMEAGFPTKTVGEDFDYANRLYPLLRTEAEIGGPPLYHYFSEPGVRARAAGLRFLVKWPTRGRAAMFKENLTAHIEALSTHNPVRFVFSVDADDPDMVEVVKVSEMMPELFSLEIGESGRGKIAAINAGIPKDDWDVLVLLADDMTPVEKDWDERILLDMMRTFPHLDGVLDYADGFRGKSANPEEVTCITMPVMGKRFYDWRGHIYHPEYKSLWCLTGDSRVYMADQTLKAIRDVRAGDIVVGTQEWAKGKRSGPRTRLAPSLVTAVHSRRAETVRVTLASGAVVQCTPDHRWGFYDSSNCPSRYGPAALGRKLIRVHKMPGLPPAGSERDRGWLAGMYDGEGSFPSIRQSFAHNPENCAELDRVLTRLGFNYVNRPYTSRKGSLGSGVMNCYYINGGRDEYLKFFEWARPVRTHTTQVRKRMFTARYGLPDAVVSIEPAGEREVFCLTTETGNFVAEGLLSHNCDNELADVARSCGKAKHLDRVIIKHDWIGQRPDALLKHNESFYAADQAVYERRKAMGFPRGSSLVYSQNDEENHILREVGASTGRLLDIGAYNGKTLSNTLRLIELGWSGVLVEPAPGPFQDLLKLHHDNPKVQLVNCALAGQPGWAQFHDSAGDAVSTLSDAHAAVWSSAGVQWRPYLLRTVTPEDLFRQVGWEFDFINLDVEGKNLEVFRAIDWSTLAQHGLRLVCVEHENNIPFMEAELAALGFELFAENPENALFRKR